ncbi:MAG: hypothetical protein IK134_01460 [Oscillospiraceae bacterium]|nr:hypothetical protein [Oscillospiraceae bacterium]
MKPQDFMEALGGVSQEKLDALAKWQEAGTPITGKAPAQEKRIMQTAAEPVPTQRRRGNMKQNTRKKASVPRLFPWNIGIGAAVVACAVIAVSIGKEVIGQERQMQVGSNAGTSMSEQIAESIADEVKNEEDSDLSLPDECTEVQATEPETLPEPFSAWYWVTYEGKSIPLDGITVDLIRTAADGEKYLTGDPEQNQTSLRTQLSKEWLETGFDEQQITDPVSGTVFSIDPDNPVQDILFIGVPAREMPSNVVRWGYHNGTITPSGKLHLDFSVQTVSDTAIKALGAEYDDDTNFYFFISIPEGSIPKLTDWDITFSTFYTGAEPDAYTAEAPEKVGFDGMDRMHAWLSEQPESESYWYSVLGAKHITPVPEEQPGTVTLTDISACPIEEPPLENKPIVSVLECGDIDNITLVLPIHDADAAVALSDLHVSADGILSLTLNEYYEKHGVDLTQDTASYQWVLGVPHGSLPEIKDIDISRVNCDDEDAFIQIAGQLCTVTIE